MEELEKGIRTLREKGVRYKTLLKIIKDLWKNIIFEEDLELNKNSNDRWKLMIQKKKRKSGSEHNAAKLSTEAVLHIRETCNGTCKSYNQLAKEFNVAESTIRNVYFNCYYKHIIAED